MNYISFPFKMGSPSNNASKKGRGKGWRRRNANSASASSLGRASPYNGGAAPLAITDVRESLIQDPPAVSSKDRGARKRKAPVRPGSTVTSSVGLYTGPSFNIYRDPSPPKSSDSESLQKATSVIKDSTLDNSPIGVP